MIIILLKVITSFIVAGVLTTFLGYCIHWMFHQSWSLWFYNAHMNHHKIQYPPTDYMSDKYRGAGKDSTVILFTLAFAPVILLIIFISFIGVLSLTSSITTILSLGAWGLIHNYIHDQLHLRNSKLNNLPLFKEWRKLHFIHHLDMKLNLGIVMFGWDKLFKSYDPARDVDFDK